MSKNSIGNDRKDDEESNAAMPPVKPEYSGQGIQEDAVFGEVVEGGPNYRNVSTFKAWMYCRTEL